MAANPSIPVRLRPVLIAYLDELDRIGGYGEGRSGVIRRLIENGVAQEIKAGVLQKKNSADFGEPSADKKDE